jgi:hypothetical protein
MTEKTDRTVTSRRTVLRAAGWLGVAAVAGRYGPTAPSPAAAQGFPKDLVPEEKVDCSAPAPSRTPRAPSSSSCP